MDIDTIRGMISEHPFGISDAAIDEIVEAIETHARWERAAGWNEGWSDGYDAAMDGPK